MAGLVIITRGMCVSVSAVLINGGELATEVAREFSVGDDAFDNGGDTVVEVVVMVAVMLVVLVVFLLYTIAIGLGVAPDDNVGDG
jgi:hypothetical protein